MKILIVPDVPGWAIDQLAQAKIRYNPHHNIKCYYVHPRDAGEKETQQRFKEVVEEFNPDIIHFEYYRSCSQLLEALPELKVRKIILTHHNQRTKALREYDWHANGVDYIVTHTEQCKQYLVDGCKQNPEKIKVINHGIDVCNFEYSDEEPDEPAIGYAGRIVPWKGLKEIAENAKEIGYPVMFMGKQDKASYWNEISQEAKDNINFSFMQCKDEERLAYYRSLTCYVGNSKDWYEEGTLEYLEAMSCGVPVITTLSGVAKDIAKDGENCLIVPFEDKEALKVAMKRLMSDKELRAKLRKGAWDTVKNMTQQKMAYHYSQLYYKLGFVEKPLVSVIIPTTLSRLQQVGEILKSLETQSYKSIEVIIAFDEKEKVSTEILDTIRETYKLSIKFVQTYLDGYNLARARNLAAVEAEGHLLLFNDSRLKPEKDAVEQFISATRMHPANVWFFGNKGANKVSFVENFSCVQRDEFMTFGMFCEQITKYGGLSQETRTRWANQGNQVLFIEDANAVELIKSSNSSNKRKDIIETKFKLFKMYKGNNH